MEQKVNDKGYNMNNIKVCQGKSCTIFGSRRVMEEIEDKYGIKRDVPDQKITLSFCGCLGRCSTAVNLLIDEQYLVASSRPENVINKIESGGVKIEKRIIETNKIDFNILAD